MTSLRSIMADDGRDLPRIVQPHPASGRRADEAAGPRDAGQPPAGSGRLVGSIPADADRELAAMHAVLAELLPLTGEQRRRVVQWVTNVIDTAARDGELPLP